MDGSPRCYSGKCACYWAQVSRVQTRLRKWIFKGQGSSEPVVLRIIIKIRVTAFFGWEVKPEVPCRKILRHVKDPLTYQRY
jgi:hypothetical protein